MLRELIDTALLEDFASGLARTAGLRVGVYDEAGDLITATEPRYDFTRATHFVPGPLPPNLPMTPVPAHDPPGVVAFVADRGVWSVVAPVYVDDREIGFVGVGEFREHSLAGDEWQQAQQAAGIELGELIRQWEALPLLDRNGMSHAVVSARWGARVLTEWTRRESRLLAAADEVALVGDIAQLLTGQEDLQKVLDRIVSETARVMHCPFCSIRLYDPKTRELRIKAVHNLPRDYVGKGAVVRLEGGLDDQTLNGQVVYIEDVTNDPRVQYPEQARRAGIVSMLTAGMIYRGNPVGVIRVYTDRRRRFRKAQRDLLRAVAYQAATAIVHAQLVDERLRNAETQRQLALAGDLQARIMRIPAPRHPRLETAAVFHPSFQVSGDFCDFVTLCDGRLAAVVADVAGKGIPASLLMSSVRGALRANAECCCEPAEILTRLNRQFCRETAAHEFVTLLLITIDAAARQLTYCNAGHEPVLILRQGHVHETSEGNLVLGIEPGERYQSHAVPLEPGDFLLLYTDGAIEARNFEEEEFGRERLRESLIRYGDLHPPQVLQNIVWDVRRFVGLAEQADDLTLVGVRVVNGRDQGI